MLHSRKGVNLVVTGIFKQEYTLPSGVKLDVVKSDLEELITDFNITGDYRKLRNVKYSEEQKQINFKVFDHSSLSYQVGVLLIN